MEEKIVLSLMDFPELYDTSKISNRDINKISRAWELVSARVGLPGKNTNMYKMSKQYIIARG